MVQDDAEVDGPTLGRTLRATRELFALSLRKAAERANLSAAYLSQLEAGGVKDPSPRLLYELAKVYGGGKSSVQGVYADFMRLAGYVVPRAAAGSQSRTALDIALSSTSPLSPNEQEALAEYLAWYRSRNSKGERDGRR
jgi:transcriptional regulator with XRE-family HTH domain